MIGPTGSGTKSNVFSIHLASLIVQLNGLEATVMCMKGPKALESS